jgi:hypothetical protein
MADPRIKQKGIDRGMTPEQIRRERDLVDQINKRLTTGQADLTEVQSLLTAPRTIGVAHVRTDGAGGFTFNLAGGITITLAGTRLRVNFSPERPTVGGEPHYYVHYMAVGTGTRTSTVTTYGPASCDLVVRNSGGAEINFSTASEEGLITISDFD